MKKYAQGRGIEARKRDFHVLIPAIFIILLFSGCSSPVEQENSKTVNPQVSLQAVETLDENYTSFFVERCGDKGPALGDLLTCLSTIFRDFNNFTVSIADCNAFTETNFPKPCSENKTDCKTVLNFGAQYCIDELAKREGDVSVCKALDNIDVGLCEADFNGTGYEYVAAKLGGDVQMTDAAVAAKDETMCSRITSEMYRDACITKVAIAKDDEDLCYTTERYAYECDKHFGAEK